MKRRFGQTLAVAVTVTVAAVVAAGAVAAAVTLPCCARPKPLAPEVVAATVNEEARLRTLVESFVRCYERAGEACYRPDTPLTTWEAVRALATARLASPPWLLSELPKAIDAQQAGLTLRAKWIAALKRHHGWVREGMCDLDALQPLYPVLATAMRDAMARVVDLGLGASPLGKLVEELATVATRMYDARLAHFDCPGRGRELYVVFVLERVRAVWRPVFMGERPPPFLVEPEGGGRQVVPGMTPPANVVDPWLPLRLEAL